MTGTQRVGWVAGLALSGLTLGCVMPDDVSRLQKDVADVQQQIRRVETTQAAAREELEASAARAADEDRSLSREELADLKLRLEQISREAATDHERLSEIERRLSSFSDELRQARGLARRGPPAPVVEPGATNEGSAPAAAGAPFREAQPEPAALYNTAYADFSKGNYALAVSGFQEYEQRFPDSAEADNALYWIGECHFSQGNFAEAIREWDRLLERYPDSDKAAASNLKKALAFLELNQVGQAIVQLRYVVSSYPDTDEARIARDKLSSLGASPAGAS